MANGVKLKTYSYSMLLQITFGKTQRKLCSKVKWPVEMLI